MKNNSLLNFFKNIISDVDGQPSSKRLVIFICTLAILITWAANLWYGLTTEEFIFNGLLYIIGIGLGVTTAEKFSRN